MKLPRHPRRLGFIAFNIVVIGLVLAWLVWAPKADFADLPNFALANTGIFFVGLAWVIAWVAWGVLLFRRRRARRQLLKTGAGLRAGGASPD